MKDQTNFKKQVGAVYKMLLGILGLFAIAAFTVLYLMANPGIFQKSEPKIDYATVPEKNIDEIENGIHLRTGLIDAKGLMVVVNNCTTCHSAKLVTQNRMNKERWISTIRWMQETQNLWDLGSNEEVIINYLVTNYPIAKKGRRKVLTAIEWYDLNE